MSHAAVGDGNIQILIKDSPNCVVTIGGRKVADLWVPRFRVPLDPARNKDLDLLLARHAITTLTGRDDLWQSSLAWCGTPDQSPSAVSIRCITGRGGSGKTRFALELAHHLRVHPNWDARFVKWFLPEPIELWSATYGADGDESNVLLIVDYAADHATPLAASLQQLANNLPQSPKRRLRILLLARTAEWDQGWLTALKPGSTNDTPIANLFDPVFHPPTPAGDPLLYELPALPPADRVALFAQALQRAADFSNIAAPALPAPTLFESERAKETLRDPLTLMMAAVVGLRTGIPEALSLTRLGLATKVATDLVADRLSHAFGDQAQLAHHMAAYLTLCGGLDFEAAQDAVVREAQANSLGTLAAPGPFTQRLQSWFPAANGALGPIEPDIVGEAFLLGSLNKGHSKPRLSHADATLLRATAHASTPVITFLIRATQDFCLPADPAEARAEPLIWLETLVTKGETDDIALLLAIASGLPHSSVVLRPAAVRVTQAILQRLRTIPATSELGAALQPEIARILSNLSVRQSQAGDRERALATATEAVALYRELAAHNRDAFLPVLATSLNNLATFQSQAGDRERALATATEAVALRRELATRNRDAFLPALATSLNNLANVQSEAGDRERALATATEALALYRELAARNRDAFIENLTKSLWTCGIVLTGMERFPDAAAAFAEGVRIILPYSQRYPAALVPLAVALVQGHLQACESGSQPPDEQLLREAFTLLGPYLQQPDSNTPEQELS